MDERVAAETPAVWWSPSSDQVYRASATGFGYTAMAGHTSRTRLPADAVRLVAAAVPEAAEPIWWCSNCEREVDAVDVIDEQESHRECGSYVETVPGAAVPEAGAGDNCGAGHDPKLISCKAATEIVRLRAQVADLSRLLRGMARRASSMRETIAVLSDRNMVAAIREGQEAVKNGDVLSVADLDAALSRSPGGTPEPSEDVVSSAFAAVEEAVGWGTPVGLVNDALIGCAQDDKADAICSALEPMRNPAAHAVPSDDAIRSALLDAMREKDEGEYRRYGDAAAALRVEESRRYSRAYADVLLPVVRRLLTAGSSAAPDTLGGKA